MNEWILTYHPFPCRSQIVLTLNLAPIYCKLHMADNIKHQQIRREPEIAHANLAFFPLPSLPPYGSSRLQPSQVSDSVSHAAASVGTTTIRRQRQPRTARRPRPPKHRELVTKAERAASDRQTVGAAIYVLNPERMPAVCCRSDRPKWRRGYTTTGPRDSIWWFIAQHVILCWLQTITFF